MTTCALHDVHDVRAFAAAAVKQTGLTVGRDEHEDLVDEGVVLLYQLAQAWNGDGRFSGYAARFLPGRIVSAWRKNHREHSYRTTPDGGRAWDWGQAPVSLDAPVGDGAMTLADTALGATGDESPEEAVLGAVPAGTFVGTPVHLLVAHDSRLTTTVRGALRESLDDEVDLHLRVSVMAAAGMSREEIRSRLGLTADDLRAVFGRLRRCAHLLDPNVRRAA